MNAFKNLAAVGIAAEYDFDQLAAMKSAAAAAPASGGGGATKAAAAAEEDKPAEKPESDDGDVDMGDLFGGGDDY